MCRCCEKNVPVDRPRICPKCRHELKGNGWDGIDAHWKSKHEDVMTLMPRSD
jgi:predicted amidophosphoribosyltransferase